MFTFASRPAWLRWQTLLLAGIVLFLITREALPIVVGFAQGEESDEPRIPLATSFAYQGRLTEAGVPADGVFDLEFVLWDAAAGGVQVGLVTTTASVTNGLFTVTLDFGAVFLGERRWLETRSRRQGAAGDLVSLGRQELTPTPYALFASGASWDGLVGIPDGIGSGVPFSNVVIVAKQGGDYNTIQAAITSITNAGPDNPYLVWIAPGTYEERVVGKANVHFQGAGRDITIIESTGGADLASGTTVILNGASSLRSLTILNTAGEPFAVGLQLTNGTKSVDDVRIRTLQDANVNHGMVLQNASVDVSRSDIEVSKSVVSNQQSKGIVAPSGTSLTLTDVTIAAAAFTVTGIQSEGQLTMTGVDVEVIGQSTILGLDIGPSGFAYHLHDIHVLALGLASGSPTGVFLDSVVTTIRNSSFTAANGTQVTGILVIGGTATVFDTSIHATGGSQRTNGILHLLDAPLRIDHADIRAEFGVNARAVANNENDNPNVPYIVSITRSSLRGSTNSVGGFTSNVTYNVSTTELSGPVGAIGDYNCVGSYNASLKPLGEACLP